MKNETFLRLQLKIIQLYNVLHPFQSRDQSALLFTKKYAEFLRIFFNPILKKEMIKQLEFEFEYEYEIEEINEMIEEQKKDDKSIDTENRKLFDEDLVQSI